MNNNDCGMWYVIKDFFKFNGEKIHVEKLFINKGFAQKNFNETFAELEEGKSTSEFSKANLTLIPSAVNGDGEIVVDLLYTISNECDSKEFINPRVEEA